MLLNHLSSICIHGQLTREFIAMFIKVQYDTNNVHQTLKSKKISGKFLVFPMILKYV